MRKRNKKEIAQYNESYVLGMIGEYLMDIFDSKLDNYSISLDVVSSGKGFKAYDVYAHNKHLNMKVYYDSSNQYIVDHDISDI